MTDVLLHLALFASTAMAATALGMGCAALIGAVLNYATGNGAEATVTQKRSQPVESDPVRADTSRRFSRKPNAQADLASGVSVECVDSGQP